MTGSEYQKLAMRTAKSGRMPTDSLMEGALGLAGEAGEVTDLIKKILCQGHLLDPALIAEELGDVMWYVALIAETIGETVDGIMLRNVQKLTLRYPDGFDESRSRERDKPRVLTLTEADLTEDGWYWVEISEEWQEDGLYHMRLDEIETGMEGETVCFSFDTPSRYQVLLPDEYNKTWRIWDRRTTDEERGKAMWDD